MYANSTLYPQPPGSGGGRRPRTSPGLVYISSKVTEYKPVKLEARVSRVDSIEVRKVCLEVM